MSTGCHKNPIELLVHSYAPQLAPTNRLPDPPTAATGKTSLSTLGVGTAYVGDHRSSPLTKHNKRPCRTEAMPSTHQHPSSTLSQYTDHRIAPVEFYEDCDLQ